MSNPSRRSYLAGLSPDRLGDRDLERCAEPEPLYGLDRSLLPEHRRSASNERDQVQADEFRAVLGLDNLPPDQHARRLHLRFLPQRHDVPRAGGVEQQRDLQQLCVVPSSVLAGVLMLCVLRADNEPLLAHLSMTANLGEMRLTWTTRDRTSPAVTHRACRMLPCRSRSLHHARR